jgi:hypothetical protein
MPSGETIELRIKIPSSPEVERLLLKGQEQMVEEIGPGIRAVISEPAEDGSGLRHLGDSSTAEVIILIVVTFVANLSSQLVADAISHFLGFMGSREVEIETERIRIDKNGRIREIVREKRKER